MFVLVESEYFNLPRVVLFVMSKSLFAGICLAFFQMTDEFEQEYLIHCILDQH